jgi:hypothetical protein
MFPAPIRTQQHADSNCQTRLPQHGPEPSQARQREQQNTLATSKARKNQSTKKLFNFFSGLVSMR